MTYNHKKKIFYLQFVLKRPITRGQFLGCIVIVISLVVAKLPDLLQIINDRKVRKCLILSLSNVNFNSLVIDHFIKLQLFHDKIKIQDSSVIKIVAEMGSTNSTDADSSADAIYSAENTDPSEATSINSVPLLAIGLAIVASCNSGKPLYLSDHNRVH